MKRKIQKKHDFTNCPIWRSISTEFFHWYPVLIAFFYLPDLTCWLSFKKLTQTRWHLVKKASNYVVFWTVRLIFWVRFTYCNCHDLLSRTTLFTLWGQNVSQFDRWENSLKRFFVFFWLHNNLFNLPLLNIFPLLDWIDCRTALFSHIGFGVNKSYNVNREVGACAAAAKYRPGVRRSWRLQEMLDFGEVVDLVCL